ncbi:hypothetical protein IT774_14945 [Salinimonas marina]|uniref:Uncharacterized protein n=1 Tax=Salinimonas marina TaxID=2785918 RepID=A0A7S9DWQ7_9ALTE|nr:hypothetical protein [Salinimonas marina]QPG05381.1 hypothetical protein IT774_14945 [Salinimonas marina]
MRIVSLLLATASLYSMGVTASPVSSQALLKCAQITQDDNRLHCFDAVVSQLQAAPAQSASASQPAASKPQPAASEPSKSAPAPAPVAKPQPSVAKAPPQANDNFGLEQKQRQQAADEISAKITKVDQGPRDKLIITLDNDMVWKQKDSAYLRAKQGLTAIVEEGALGAFYLKVEGSNRRIKVERLR